MNKARSWSEAERLRAKSLLEDGRTYKSTAEILTEEFGYLRTKDMVRKQLRSGYIVLDLPREVESNFSKEMNTATFSEEDNYATIEGKFDEDKAPTLETLLNKFNIDTDVWDATNFKVNQWDVSAKEEIDGRIHWNTHKNYQAKATLIRKIPVKFEFPKLELRDSGTEGFAANPYQAMYGIRPKISDSSNLHDNDYIDYLRGLPASYRSQLVTPTGNFEHSFTFSLDNLVINTPNVTVVHTSGSHADGSAYTSTNSVQDLLALGVSNWAMPLFGGYDGLDIKEKEPFRTGLMQSSDTKQTNYLKNSFDQAVESIADEEVVPANLLLAPGLRNSHLTNKLIATADSRQDVLAVVDLENDYLPAAEATSTNIGDKAARRGSVKDAIDGLKTRNIDSSFACTFYPWVQITDRLGGSELVWVPSSIAARSG